jgi:uncharacterized membrane protein (DUF485 family)
MFTNYFDVLNQKIETHKQNFNRKVIETKNKANNVISKVIELAILAMAFAFDLVLFARTKDLKFIIAGLAIAAIATLIINAKLFELVVRKYVVNVAILLSSIIVCVLFLSEALSEYAKTDVQVEKVVQFLLEYVAKK